MRVGSIRGIFCGEGQWEEHLFWWVRVETRTKRFSALFWIVLLVVLRELLLKLHRNRHLFQLFWFNYSLTLWDGNSSDNTHIWIHLIRIFWALQKKSTIKWSLSIRKMIGLYPISIQSKSLEVVRGVLLKLRLRRIIISRERKKHMGLSKDILKIVWISTIEKQRDQDQKVEESV